MAGVYDSFLLGSSRGTGGVSFGSLSGVNVAYSPFIGRRDIQEGTLWDLAKMFWCDLVSVYISRRIWSVSWKLDPGDIRFCFWLAAFLGI